MKNKLILGHPSIDHHHDEVFDIVQKLDAAIIENDNQYIDKIIDFFNHYVKDHFGEEEDLMKGNNFEGLNEHQKEHEFFRRRFNEIYIMYEQKRHLTHLVFQIRQFLDNLIEHIIETDSQMAHLIEHGEEK